MRAVIRVGGKQERVAPGDVIEVEYMEMDPGSAVEFQPLVVFDDQGQAHVGSALGKARVLGRLLGDRKAEKIRVFKYRPKSGYRRTQGHRQRHTVIEIDEVALSPDQRATREDAAAATSSEDRAATGAKEPAAKKPAAKKTEAKGPAARKPAAKKPTAKKPTAKKPATKKPASRKPSGGEPG